MAADRAQIDNNVLFEDGVDAEGVGERGTLRLTAARIGGRLGLRDGHLRNTSGPALLAVDLRTFLRLNELVGQRSPPSPDQPSTCAYVGWFRPRSRPCPNDALRSERR